AAGKDYLTSWTVAFAPYDRPEIVLVVAVEDVHEGQVATLPVARDALQWYFRNK
ncbi:MAG: penicillin-binding protein, partial [Candidatus Wildermuthbacteria bacterium]|nr:penicillin-binding protein [Candidatus Wildermuthbacteria bacterium]